MCQHFNSSTHQWEGRKAKEKIEWLMSTREAGILFGLFHTMTVPHTNIQYVCMRAYTLNNPVASLHTDVKFICSPIPVT